MSRPALSIVSRTLVDTHLNGTPMILTIGVALFVIWFLGFMLLRKVLGAVIHIVLIIAICAIAWHFVAGG